MLNPLLLQYQTYWYSIVYFSPGTSPTDTAQSISALIPVLLISCLSTRPIDTSKTAQVSVHHYFSVRPIDTTVH